MVSVVPEDCLGTEKRKKKRIMDGPLDIPVCLDIEVLHFVLEQSSGTAIVRPVTPRERICPESLTFRAFVFVFPALKKEWGERSRPERRGGAPE